MQIIMQICQISFLVTSYHPRWGVFGPHGRVYLKCFEDFTGRYIGHIKCYYRNKPERMRGIGYGRM